MDPANLIEQDIEAYLELHRNKELLRFLTCGSVDDGKSTLIGRLLHDTKMIYEDQLAALTRDSRKHGTTGDGLDLALLVDGLQAEREQGITIDVAYRYFSTARRKFIIADTPGHEQYTRNMATGASTCNLAVILIDARHGVLPQTRRHTFIATLLGIKHLVVAINKMDLVGYSEEVYAAIRHDFSDFAAKLDVEDLHFIPMSALKGDNVVERSTNMPWYLGSPLLDFLESVHIASDRNLIDLRLPVQLVMRPDATFRGYAGTMASGVLRVGDEVAAIPSGRRTRVRSIRTYDGDLTEAYPPLSVTVCLEDEIDLSRGDLLAHPANRPQLAHSIEAMVVWMDHTPLKQGLPYLLKHTGILTSAEVVGIRYRVNVNDLHREQTNELTLNEIGRVRLEVARALPCDPYARNRTTGAFVLIDRLTNATVAAGMILERAVAEERKPAGAAEEVGAAAESRVRTEQRAERLGQDPFVVWLSGGLHAKRAAVAYELEARLFGRGCHVYAIDAENSELVFGRPGALEDTGSSEAVEQAVRLGRLVGKLGHIVIIAVSYGVVDPSQVEDLVGPARVIQFHLGDRASLPAPRTAEPVPGEPPRPAGSTPSGPTPTGGLMVVDAALTVEQATDHIIDVLARKALVRSAPES
jgi:bifunctional enzyme CysN/CysC